MELGLNGRVAVVTGASRGIGTAILRSLRDEGATVVNLDIRSPGSGRVGDLDLTCDVTSPSEVESAVSEIDDTYGRIDVLVNNAGIMVEAPAESIEMAVWRRVFEVNVEGVLNMCQAVAPIMKRQAWGRIVNAASFAAIVPSVGSSAYAASKAAVVQLSRTLASELGPWGITVNSYAPGMVPTEMNGFEGLAPAMRDAKLDQLAIRRWGTPEEVAQAVTFLASECAGYITGSLLDVSGGKLATQSPSTAYAAPYAGGA
ncbi:SDR family oxidoreductase [Tessaracoccus rhinocerotis]|uniref:SDR family oxidoreductase n=1 Tax=Tessaracoccus rhinocerotis TaxID=1689449 RepID=A0A553K6B7_9ACTN|nr:SDR family oxidoreductase [Tessaracoccus rhinocerotis]